MNCIKNIGECGTGPDRYSHSDEMFTYCKRNLIKVDIYIIHIITKMLINVLFLNSMPFEDII